MIWNEINNSVFAGILVMPKFRRTRNRDTYAAYEDDVEENRIWINQKLVNSFELARKIIYHEMIHQYVYEYLHHDEEPHHDAEFWANYKFFAPTGIELFEELD